MKKSVMNKSLGFNKYNLIKSIWDISFVLWFITENTMTHSTTARFALGLFGAITALVIVLEMKIKLAPVICLFYCLFVVICYLNIKLGYSISPGESKSLLYTLIKNFFFLIMFYHFAAAHSIDDLKKIFLIATTSAVVLLLAVTYVNTGSFALRGKGRLTNVNSLAVCTGYAVCWMITSGGKLKLSDFFILSTLTLFIILSGTRKAFIAIIIGIVVYLYLKHPNKLVRNVIISIMFFIVTYYIVIKVPFLYKTMGHRIESFIALLQNSESDASAKTRSHFIKLGWKYIKERPVLGFGINSFKTVPKSYGTYSHNNYIELLFSVGIVGTISYYLIHIFILVKAIKQYLKVRTNNIIVALTLMIIVLAMDVGMVSYYSRTSLLLLIICSALSERINIRNEDY